MGILDNNNQPMYSEEDIRNMQQQMRQQIEQEYHERNAMNSPNSKLPISQEFHILRINFDDDINDFGNWLRGFTPDFDADGRKTYRKTHDKIMNERGCNRVTAVVAAFLKKSIILGFLTDEQILMKMNYFMKEFAHLVCLNSHRWDLDKTERTILVKEVVTLVHLTMTRSLEGNEADQLSTAISRIEHADIKNQQPQQGMSLGRMLSLRQR